MNLNLKEKMNFNNFFVSNLKDLLSFAETNLQQK
jgi:hypothetical protein